MQYENNYKNIPSELIGLPHWVCFDNDKRPIDPKTRHGADANDPSTWATFAEVQEYATNHGYGIGFEFSGTPYAGIDLDKCIDAGGILSDEARRIVDTMDCYTEYSPSGNGIHIIVNVGDLSIQGKGNKTTKIEGMEAMEMYTEGRYFTMTGDVCGEPRPIAERTEAFTDVHNRYIKKPENPQENRPQAFRMPLSEQEILGRIRNSKQATEFSALYDQGDISGHGGDDSAADLALCNILAFWTGGDPSLMDFLFRQSALMREKWDRMTGGTTYGAMTVEKAIAGCTAFYDKDYGMAVEPKVTDTPQNNKTEQSSSALNALGIMPLSDCVACEPEYFIDPYLVKHEVNILAGRGGVGKTGVALSMAAAYSSSDCRPAQMPFNINGEGITLIITTENRGGILRGKIERDFPTADFTRILIKERGVHEISSPKHLEEIILATGATFVIIDPLSSVGIDINKSDETRVFLDLLSAMGQQHAVTFLCIHHMNKAQRADAIDRIGGSTNIVNAARSVLICGWDDDGITRAVAHLKHNYKKGQPFCFSIGSDGEFAYTVGGWDITAEDLLNNKESSDGQPIRDNIGDGILHLAETDFTGTATDARDAVTDFLHVSPETFTPQQITSKLKDVQYMHRLGVIVNSRRDSDRGYVFTITMPTS